MDKFLQEPIGILKKIQSVIQNIGMNEFKKYSRNDLTEFAHQLIACSSFSSIIVQLDKLIEEKKLEEYPQLKGVHHYPEVDEIEFLSEDEKIKLDTYLSRLRPNYSYILMGSSAWGDIFTSNHLEEVHIEGEQTISFLDSKGIIQKNYQIYCPCCHGRVSICEQEQIIECLEYFRLSEFGKSDYIKKLSHEEKNNLSNKLEDLYVKTCDLDLYCDGCEEGFEINKEMIEDIINDSYYHVYKLIKERDKSLDNV